MVMRCQDDDDRPPTLGFKNTLQKRMCEATDTKSMFYTVYGLNRDLLPTAEHDWWVYRHVPLKGMCRPKLILGVCHLGVEELLIHSPGDRSPTCYCLLWIKKLVYLFLYYRLICLFHSRDQVVEVTCYV